MRADVQPLIGEAFTAYADATRRVPTRVVPASLPVLFFGDLDAYRVSERRIITVALNPSRAEFPSQAPRSRFPRATNVDPASPLSPQSRDDYLTALCEYFEREPLTRWFGGPRGTAPRVGFEPLLNALGASYYAGLRDRALHTDICTPVATDPAWSSGLSRQERADLQRLGGPLWRALVEALAPDLIISSFAAEHLAVGGLPPLADPRWETVSVIQRDTPFITRAIPTQLGNGALAVHGKAVNLPFGSLTPEDKAQVAGRIVCRLRLGLALALADATTPTSTASSARRPANSSSSLASGVSPSTLPPSSSLPLLHQPSTPASSHRRGARSVYPHFPAFYDAVVAPRLAADPHLLRLDGRLGGPNGAPAGWFIHAGRQWRVNLDTRIDRLRIAFDETRRQPGADPFRKASTGKRDCLELRDDLRPLGPKYLFVYAAD